jgi:hypothetical protein
MRSLSWTALLLSSVSLLLVFGASRARQIEDWPYDKLFKHADVVVIAKALTVRDAKEEDGVVPPDGSGDVLVGVVTRFQVLRVVQGEHKEKELDLVHFRSKQGITVDNGPTLVSFHTKKTQISGKDWAASLPSEYLLFLKKRQDGRFECVSGQYDPALSVKQVLQPLR